MEFLYLLVLICIPYKTTSRYLPDSAAEEIMDDLDDKLNNNPMLDEDTIELMKADAVNIAETLMKAVDEMIEIMNHSSVVPAVADIIFEGYPSMFNTTTQIITKGCFAISTLNVPKNIGNIDQIAKRKLANDILKSNTLCIEEKMSTLDRISTKLKDMFNITMEAFETNQDQEPTQNYIDGIGSPPMADSEPKPY